MLQLTKIILYLKAEKHYKTIFRPIEANVFLNLEIGNTFFILVYLIDHLYISSSQIII